MPMQQQLGSSDRGIFVIADAILITVGHDFSSFVFDQSQMRSHLIQCFEEKTVTISKDQQEGQTEQTFALSYPYQL